ncbi:MAG TPA: hypothetical protein VN519_02205 [Bryobacteraceae bacterium]|nr:hypothetical protein [Bryobacteraceae bacterium]
MFRTTASLCAVALTATLAAHADFSYSKTQKVTGGSMAAMAGSTANREGNSYFKGEKAAEVSNDSSILIDFAAQTITTINKVQKTYKVQKFGDVAAAGSNADVSVNVQDTGQTKTINGYNAKESLVTLDVDLATGRGPAMKMAAEIEVWRSTDVPGAAEMRAFYEKNAANFPWAAMMGAGGNQSIQRAMTLVQKKLAESDGMVVEEVIRVKPAAGGPGPQMAQMPRMTPEQQAKMQAAMAQMQAMSKQGGAQAAAAQRAMAAMSAMSQGPAAANGAGNALIEITVDNTGFSTEPVPDSVFVVPSDYKQLP